MEYIGIHLFLKSTEDKNKTQVRARYTISVLDADGKKRFTGECSKSEGRIFKAGKLTFRKHVQIVLIIVINRYRRTWLQVSSSKRYAYQSRIYNIRL